MAQILHWIGVLMLLVSFALLMVTTVSAPVVGDIALLKVNLVNQTDIRHSSVTFGTFGHCILDVPPDSTDQDFCFPKVVGYKPSHIMAAIDGTSSDFTGSGTADVLTYVMILHPIAAAVTFIAFLLAFIPGIAGALIASIITALAWVITVVVMATDFALWGIIKDHVNGDGSGNHAEYQIGMWTILAAMILLFFATFIVLFSCFGRRKAHKAKGETYYDNKHNSTGAYQGNYQGAAY